MEVENEPTKPAKHMRFERQSRTDMPLERRPRARSTLPPLPAPHPHEKKKKTERSELCRLRAQLKREENGEAKEKKRKERAYETRSGAMLLLFGEGSPDATEWWARWKG